MIRPAIAGLKCSKIDGAWRLRDDCHSRARDDTGPDSPGLRSDLPSGIEFPSVGPTRAPFSREVM